MPMTRLRLTFSKDEPMRFTGHLDVQRTLERTLNPHGWPSIEAVATTGQGVQETQEKILSMVLDTLRSRSRARRKA